MDNKTNIKNLPIADQIAGTDLVLVSVNGKARRALASLLKGQKGDEVELQITETHIQWRLTNGEWANLISFAELRGPVEDAAEEARIAAEQVEESLKDVNKKILDVDEAINMANTAADRVNTAVNNIENKLDKDGDGKDVSITFGTVATRIELLSGEKLSLLLGKISRWLSDLKEVAFSGEASDLFEDESHRFVSDTEKSDWNGKAAGTHTHKASEVMEEADKRWLMDAERTKIADTYGKSETYTQGEIDTKDIAILDAAKKYVIDRISDIISGSPAALDTLYEIANALNNDPAFATTIMALINGKADSVHKHTKSQITDFPASLPASDVYPWAKASNKPKYSVEEIDGISGEFILRKLNELSEITFNKHIVTLNGIGKDSIL